MRINSYSKPYRVTINPRFKIWWGLKLISVLVVCSAAKPGTNSSFHHFYAGKLLSKHLLIQPIHHSLSDSDTIAYKGVPVLCPGGSLLLSAGNAPSNASFKWFENGSDQPIATTATYTATTPGNYTVTTEANGVIVNYPSLLITQGSFPVAQFSYTTTSDCPSSPVNFTNSSTGDGLAYNWDFGDPNATKASRTSNLANPSHTFIGTPGNGSQTFIVTLTVTNKSGCTNTVTNSITLQQSPDPTLGGGNTMFNSREYFASCTNAPTTFSFTNLSSTDNVSYNIFWGDGSGTTTLNNFTTISHTYRVGNFTMFYTVNGKNGCSITKKYYVFVGQSPQVAVSNLPVFACTNTPFVLQTTNNTNDNSVGTLYVVTFSDDEANLFNYSLQGIAHIFRNNSVGKTSQKQNTKFANSYSATIIASNPCGADTAIIAPIYISDNPNPSFNVNLNTVCAGDSITCTNLNPNAAYIDSLGNSHSQNLVWSISPNNGYVVNSLSLGQTNGKNIPSLWTNGSQNLNIKFTTAGNYTLKMITGNDICGIDSTIKTICVNPLPTALFSLSDTSNCAPFSVSTVNQSNNSLCGSNAYKWTVSYLNNGCGNYLGNFTYLSGDSSSLNPQFNFIDPGIYTINLVNAFVGSQCNSAAYSKQVIVRQNPVIAITSSNEGVTNQKFLPTGSLKDCTSSVKPTFSWSFPGGEPASSNAFEPDSVVYKHAGVYNISFSVTNECGTTTVNKSITISDFISLSNAFIPNCFTPNGDGINDTWDINGVEQNHLLYLQIFNRYGTLVSQIKGNPITWDGKYKGEKLPAGVYYYVLSIYNDNVHTKKRSGSLTILY